MISRFVLVLANVSFLGIDGPSPPKQASITPGASPNDEAASEMAEGEVSADNEKSGSIRPSAATWMPNPPPCGQKPVPTFPAASSSATIGPSSRSRLGNVGQESIQVGYWAMGATMETMPPGPFSFELACIDRTKALYRNGDGAAAGDVRMLVEMAQQALGAGPYSVTYKRSMGPSDDTHDYVSLSRYKWPNPETPDALPYVKRDGESNPELDRYDRKPLGELCDAVSNLALAGAMPHHEVMRTVESARAVVAPCVVDEDGDRDGLPTVILEAMALGVSVISTPVTSIPEVVIDNQTGLLVNERDPEALARTIERLLRSDALCRRLGAAALSKVRSEFHLCENVRRLKSYFLTG